jgi:hypothetical protein
VSKTRTCAEPVCGAVLHFNTKRDYCNDHLHLVQCEAPECEEPVATYRQGRRLQVQRLCGVHLSRWRLYGSYDAHPEREPWPAFDDPEGWIAWLRRRVKVDEHNCWLWASEGSVNATTGYVNLGMAKGYPSNGHRMAVWADTYRKTGEPPQITGFQVDHQCHMLSSAPAPRRHCVNPDHLVLRKGTENRAEAVYRKARDTQVRELVAALREVAPGHEILKRYTEWQC